MSSATNALSWPSACRPRCARGWGSSSSRVGWRGLAWAHSGGRSSSSRQSTNHGLRSVLGVRLAGGLVLTALSIQERLGPVTDDTVTPSRGATTTTHQRSDVDSAFMDGKALVLLDRSGAGSPASAATSGRIASPPRCGATATRGGTTATRTATSSACGCLTCRACRPPRTRCSPPRRALEEGAERYRRAAGRNTAAGRRGPRRRSARQYWRVVPSLEG